MQNAYTSKYSYKYHRRIVDIVEPKVVHMLKSFREFPYAIKGDPPYGLKKFADMEFSRSNPENSSMLLSVPVKDLRTLDPSSKDFRFQRHIKVENSIKFINDKLRGEPAGFSYDYCGILEGTLFYNPEEDLWYVFIEIGQHRSAMAFLVGGENIELPVKVFLPKFDVTPDELLVRESTRHFVDATKRTGQNQVDKLSSAYFSESQEAIELVKFYKDCEVSIGEVLPYEKRCDSWSEIAKGITEYSEPIMRRCLSVIAKYSNEKEINAKAVLALAQLITFFKERVDNFERLQGLDFVDTIVKYVFVERQPKVLKMGDITKFSGKYKGTELVVTTWLSYINEMFDWREKYYKKDNKAGSWMSRRSLEFKEFLDIHVDELFHDTFKQRIERM